MAPFGSSSRMSFALNYRNAGNGGSCQAMDIETLLLDINTGFVNQVAQVALDSMPLKYSYKTVGSQLYLAVSACGWPRMPG